MKLILHLLHLLKISLLFPLKYHNFKMILSLSLKK
nr:MAG TPA: hypothetical protein [Caudoviricetes sp.]